MSIEASFVTLPIYITVYTCTLYRNTYYIVVAETNYLQQLLFPTITSTHKGCVK